MEITVKVSPEYLEKYVEVLPKVVQIVMNVMQSMAEVTEGGEV